ncbi:hypothetical protein D6D10_07635 [Aureobasidium pullulans]|uniref:Uncharacterized protein n=1 Tax=Aureobasidium pullulans TaxID=5580 RepID=A0A4S9EKX3_AURPU|nr:hypothetical protein D6D10_07635 [Aureobasidium pullulans]
MCVANLNVSTQPCSHRWYSLVKPCTSTTNLANCPSKLALEGWETRLESCPWCDDSASDSGILDDSNHRLFGGSVSRSRSGSIGASVTSPMPLVAERHRRQSSATNSTTSLSRSTSSRIMQDDDDEAEELGRGEKARMMNWRLDVYLMSHPERKQRLLQEDEGIAPEASVPEQGGLSRSGSIRRSGSLLGKKMKKGMRLGKTIFKG